MLNQQATTLIYRLVLLSSKKFQLCDYLCSPTDIDCFKSDGHCLHTAPPAQSSE